MGSKYSYNPKEIEQQYSGTEQEIENSESMFETADMTKFLEASIKTDIPAELKEKDKEFFQEFWNVLDRSIVFTFLKEKDVRDFELLYQIQATQFIMGKAPWEITHALIRKIDALKMTLLARLRRAVGTGTTNERVLMATQIRRNETNTNENLTQTTATKGRRFF